MISRSAPAPSGQAVEEIGLYVHVPFCRSRCVYCDFYVETGREDLFENYARALIAEWGLVQREVLGGGSPRIATVYFGGGTPSLLDPRMIGDLLDAVAGTAVLDPEAEITLEANPESVTREKAAGWRAAGVNRVSLGIQSFDAADLEALQRPHTVSQAFDAVATVRRAGVPRLSLDLIYGIRPGGSEAYRASLETAAGIDPGHLSCYLLTVEEGTPLGRLVRGGRWEVGTDDEAASDYAWTREMLRTHGYAAYEISNFARPGHESRHNGRYWLRGAYIGIGPGAHSFHGGARWSNVARLGRYLEAVLERGTRPVTGLEIIDDAREAEEWIFLGLRRAEGIPWPRLRPLLPAPSWDRLDACRAALVERGLLVEERGSVRLAERAVFLSNAVIVELLSALEASPEEVAT